MKKPTTIALLLAAAVFFNRANAQNQTEHDPTIRSKDSLIKVNMIDPAEAGGQTPDWLKLTKTISAQYDAVYADRTITKAKIYFYYGKDWPQFCAAIVHYTNKYEDPNDLPLMSMNAQYILAKSTDKSELQSALQWSKKAAAGEPSNQIYKDTEKALQAKLDQL